MTNRRTVRYSCWIMCVVAKAGSRARDSVARFSATEWDGNAMAQSASTRARIGTVAIDAATIASIALVLAAFYCVAKIVPTPEASLLFPRLASFDFLYAAPDYFPWTDLAGNVFV